MSWSGEAGENLCLASLDVFWKGDGWEAFFLASGLRRDENPYSRSLTRFLQYEAYSPLNGMLVQIVHGSITIPSPNHLFQ